jgi:hypothetical protein
MKEKLTNYRIALEILGDSLSKAATAFCDYHTPFQMVLFFTALIPTAAFTGNPLWLIPQILAVIGYYIST